MANYKGIVRSEVKKIIGAHVRIASLAVASALRVPVNAIEKQVIQVLVNLAVNSFNERRRFPRVRLTQVDDWEDEITSRFEHP